MALEPEAGLRGQRERDPAVHGPDVEVRALRQVREARVDRAVHGVELRVAAGARDVIFPFTVESSTGAATPVTLTPPFTVETCTDMRPAR